MQSLQVDRQEEVELAGYQHELHAGEVDVLDHLQVEAHAVLEEEAAADGLHVRAVHAGRLLAALVGLHSLARPRLADLHVRSQVRQVGEREPVAEQQLDLSSDDPPTHLLRTHPA